MEAVKIGHSKLRRALRASLSDQLAVNMEIKFEMKIDSVLPGDLDQEAPIHDSALCLQCISLTL